MKGKNDNGSATCGGDGLPIIRINRMSSSYEGVTPLVGCCEQEMRGKWVVRCLNASAT